ncbi:uncharacterized protein HMPREF1541_08135 [Cyphellophora europaea CBS 101466]|uniref:WSC domain-containing protein n=1 Tax=Cyphellophora europaea (strain CBS 101466) TaxID=1220924 RepID=W2RLE9_CYPE1|nr:uncharacterized protein HMPREF1541_08135 [Cyphellophora europaea CBS 101466]ETN37145.1 hypothetical protein HMPREF1541_08135 [Cyphellophora europaea CBS 101466]
MDVSSLSLASLLGMLLTLISIVSSAPPLPIDEQSLQSAAFDLAESPVTEHASFESHSSAHKDSDVAEGLDLAPDLPHPLVRRADSIEDLSTANPYKYELCCVYDFWKECDIQFTYICRSEYTFKCNLDGKLTWRKDNDECHQQCGCFEPDVVSGDTTTLSRRQVVEAARLEAASPFDYVDYTRRIPRGRETRTTAGGFEMDLAAIASIGGHKSRSVSLEGSDNSDLAIGSPEIVSRAALHNWALACWDREYVPGGEWLQENRTRTALCTSPPWGYSCDSSGTTTYRVQNHEICERRCVCNNMDPRPRCIDTIKHNFIPGCPGVGSPGLRRSIPLGIEANTSEPQLTTDLALSLVGGNVKRAELHNYAIVCATGSEGRWTANATWTAWCTQAPYSYSCTSTGAKFKLQFQQYCESNCICVDVDPKPRCILLGTRAYTPCQNVDGSKRSLELPNNDVNNSDTNPEGTISALMTTATATLDSEAVTQGPAPEDAAWHLFCVGPDTDEEKAVHTTYCASAPQAYSCDTSGQPVSLEVSLRCDSQCYCVPRADEKVSATWELPGVSDAAGARPDPSRALAKELSHDIFGEHEDISTEDVGTVQLFGRDAEAGGMFKRHLYALVCELDGVRDSQITKACASAPRGYSCNRYGHLTRDRYDNYCDQHCACQYMNLSPGRMGETISLPDGGLPVPCAWCKRGDDDTEPTDSLTSIESDKSAAVNHDEVWVLDCSSETGVQDLDLVKRCGFELGSSCNDQGEIHSGRSGDDPVCASRCFWYQTPVMLSEG